MQKLALSLCIILALEQCIFFLYLKRRQDLNVNFDQKIIMMHPVIANF